MLTPEQRRSGVLLGGYMFIGMVLEVTSISIIVPLISILMSDDLIKNYTLVRQYFNYFGASSKNSVVLIAILSLLFIYTVKNSFLAYLSWRQSKFAYGVQQQKSQSLFASYLARSYSFHLSINSAQLIRNVLGEVNIFTTAVTGTLALITETMVVVGLGLALLYAQPAGAILVLLVLGVSAYFFLKITKSQISKWGKQRQYHEGLRLQHLQQGLNGIKEVMVFDKKSFFQKQYELHNVISCGVSSNQYALQQLPRLWLEFLAVFGLAILVVAMMSQNKQIDLILPILALFAASAFRLIPSVNRIVSAIQAIRYASAVINNLYVEVRFADSLPDQPVYLNSEPLKFTHKIELIKIIFSYDSASKNALNETSFNIYKGECIGVMGASGSGKSTLADILLGLLKPANGHILVDGVDIETNMNSWRKNIGYVSQTIYLVDDSLKRNIAFGVPDDQIDDQAVERALNLAQLGELVTELPKGLNTVVGERGVRLSGGQRQRVGLARALYNDPEILVLDEATSALDNATEKEVMSAINQLQGTKTIVIIAHRLSTLEGCDRIFELNRGDIVQVVNQKYEVSKIQNS
ncbi:MAG: ABC transporter ATP-binding protein [Methylophilaceae bacterium]